MGVTLQESGSKGVQRKPPCRTLGAPEMLQQQQEDNRKSQRTRIIRHPWEEKMSVTASEWSPEFEKRQLGWSETVAMATDDREREVTSCCFHVGCEASHLGDCRVFRLFCLDRIEDIFEAAEMKKGARPLLRGMERPWVEELQRRRQKGERYLKYFDYLEEER